MQAIISKILPILMLLALGLIIRRFRLIDDKGMHGIRKIIIDVAIPALLFKIFLEMDLRIEYLAVVAIAMAFYLLAHLGGRVLRRFKPLKFRMLPYVTTAFSFGLIGVPLFQIAFGVENLDSLSILGIANELFTWIFLVTFFKIDYNNERFGLGTVKKLATSPLLICVFSGLLLNILGLTEFIQTTVVLDGIYTTVEMVAGVVTPLILISVGYGIVIKKQYVKASIKYVLVRLAILFIVGYAVKLLVLDRLVQDKYFDFAFFTLLILPPSMGIQIVAVDYCTQEELDIGSNIIAVSTIACIVMFVGYVIVVSAMGLV